MKGKIFAIRKDGALSTLEAHEYVSEKRLQELLKAYPDLLAGDQIDEENARRWLLVSREVGVPTEEHGGNWLALDHLFLDQDAIPTLVEVKRGSNTQLRRKVVGQMLDYASNAVAFWSVERLREEFEKKAREEGLDSVALIEQLIVDGPDTEADVDAFWKQVESNLKEGKIRLIFVADEIPAELKRIVEFLNAYMAPVEVLAIEIKQFVGEGTRTLVPRVIGQTTQAQNRKNPRPSGKRSWDEDTFFQELENKCSLEDANVARRILTWAKETMPDLYWGTGEQTGAFTTGLMHGGIWHQAMWVATYGRVEIQFQHMRDRPPFDDEEMRRALLTRLNQVPGINLPVDSYNRRPSVRLVALRDESVLERFLAGFDWMVDTIKSDGGEG